VPNETNVSRVSVDFRVIPRSCYIEQAEFGNEKGFVLGGFYCSMDASGKVTRAKK
jgi:hypothetical protein